MGNEWIPSDVMQAAQEEGEVVVYGAVDEPDLKDPIKPRFEEAFPGITARVSGLGTSEIASKLVSEKRANNVQSDVTLYSRPAGRAVASAGVYVDLEQDHWLKQQASEMGYAEGYWKPPSATTAELPGYGLPFTLIYNTDKVSESEAPDSWEGLGDDQWTGSNGIVMQHPSQLSSMGGLYATLFGLWGEEKWTRQVGRLVDNNPQLISSNSQSYRTMIQGEKALSPNYINDLVAQLDAGDNPPAATKWLEPALQSTISTRLTADSRNPNAGMVFASWFVSEPGQQTIGDTGRTPIHGPTASTHDLFKQVIPEGVTIRPQAYNNPTYEGSVYLQNPDAFLPLFEEHFGG